MEKEFPKNQKQSTEEGYVIVSSYFLDYCVEILGTGPGMLYIQLLNYCYKGKDLAWPTLATLGKKMQFTPKSITKFHQILLKHGLIKKISKRKTASGNYRRNIYQVTPLHMVKNTLSIGNNFPHIEEKITPNLGKKLPINNTNLKQYQGNNNKERENAVAAVDFKKLKEKGEERMHAVREQLRDLDIEGKFIEQLLKDYPPRKIEEKIDLLMERRNIKSPAGWLSAALKNDYHDPEKERYDEEPLEQVSRQTPLSHLNSTPSMGKKFRETIVIDSHLSPEDRKIQSRERVLKMIRKTRKMLANLKTKGGTNVRAKISN